MPKGRARSATTSVKLLADSGRKTTLTRSESVPRHTQGPTGPLEKRADAIERDYLSSDGFGSAEQVAERLAQRAEHGLGYAIHYFPEAAYDRSGVELFEREVIGSLG